MSALEPPAARAPVPAAAAVLTADDIPRFGNAKSIADALRTVIMTRLLHDDQTRDERIAPILMENLALAGPGGADPYAYASPAKTQDQLIDEVSARRFGLGLGLTDRDRDRDRDRDESPFLAARSWLAARFERRRGALSEKTEYLQAEYKALHARWRRHCDVLNQQARPVEPVESALPVSGRTTRRSAATLGDTFVRSDLEMEQIIASLGYDEATDPNQLSTRNLAVIPDMISVTGETAYAFDDTNHLVENPSEYYAPCTGIHDWTEKEKELFLDKYAAYPKQFGLIAEFLPNKTAAQCVDYYYLHKKKLIDFRRVVYQFAPNKRKGRRRTGRQKGNGLLSDIRQHDAEVHGDFDDSASYTGRPTRGRRTIAPEPRKPSSRRNALQLEEATTATPTPEPEARPKRRRAAVSSLSVLFQDDMDEDTVGEEEPKKKKRGRKPKSAAAVLDDFATPIPTPPITEIEDQLPIPDPVPDPIQMWSSDEKGLVSDPPRSVLPDLALTLALFLELLAQHGENFKRIAVAMPNKTSFQVADYFKANLVALDLASVLPKRNQRLPGTFPIPPVDVALSSAPSPSTSSGPVDESAESSLNQPPQNDDIDASSVLDPNAMWDSMDPGSGARSPRETKFS
ncbi:hypothetical protein B0H14DRAFT_2393951 [Mycena olivaceomarginata]|nr:hypothetical protein B0H14DRAFT_2393951 [Mycena olivaceomarginata]